MALRIFAAPVIRRVSQTFGTGVPRVYNQSMAFRPQSANSIKKGKTPPPEDTFEESAYLKLLGEKQKPVTIKLVHGEVVRGWVEYYDRNMIRLTRDNAPNLFIYKHEIMYIAESGGKEAPRKPRPENTEPTVAPDGSGSGNRS